MCSDWFLQPRESEALAVLRASQLQNLGSAIEYELVNASRLDWGGGTTVPVASPSARGSAAAGRSAYQWHPSSLRISLSGLRLKADGKLRYDDWVWNAYRKKMQETRVTFADGRTRDLWDWAFDEDRKAAARDVLAYGRKTGYEKCILLDYRTAERFADVEDGKPNSVNVTDALRQARREGRTVVAVHNHDDGQPPSPLDVAVTVSWPGTLRETVVAVPGGFHELRPGPLADPKRPDRALAYMMAIRQTEIETGVVSDELWARELKELFVRGEIYHDYRGTGS